MRTDFSAPISFVYSVRLQEGHFAHILSGTEGFFDASFASARFGLMRM